MLGSDLSQFVLYAVVLVLLAPPLGRYMAAVYAGELHWLDRWERVAYRLLATDPDIGQHWSRYALAVIASNLVGFVLLYAILRLQGYLPLNPEHMPAIAPDLAFNTAISFVTNTNWQSYSGEASLSYFAHMLGLTVQNFVSAATGMAVAVAVIRGFQRGRLDSIGNFWADLVRGILYILLPLSLMLALLLVASGVPQNFSHYVEATTLEGGKQFIAEGPVASQVAIKQLGTNGGGFFGTNSAHPYENPTPLSGFLELVAILLIPAAFPFTYGRMLGDARQGQALFAAMAVLFVVALAGCYVAEKQGHPLLPDIVTQADGNMEGKEVRFGVGASSLWAVATTAASNGSVNAMHDSFTPLGGLVPMVLIMTGEIIFGGVGTGLYSMLLYVVLTVFIAGLMVGRTPEILGKKIEAREVRLAVLAMLSMPIGILVAGSLATMLPTAVASVLNKGPHGLSELLYAYSSATGNNGSAFAGFNANTPFHNTLLGLCMLLGRYAFIVPMLAIAGSLAGKPSVPPSPGTFPTHTPLFVGLLIGVIVIVGSLTFFPVLALGPIAEQLAMLAGNTY
jgi:K+-transporting ATPase ATPase A chain